MHAILHRSGDVSTTFGIRLQFRFPDNTGIVTRGHYAFQLASKPDNRGFVVVDEECAVEDREGIVARYRIHDGEMIDQRAIAQHGFLNGEPVYVTAPLAPTDRLYLVFVSGLPPFRPVYDALTSMSFFNLQPDRIREPQVPDEGDRLAADGSNLASILVHCSARFRTQRTGLRNTCA